MSVGQILGAGVGFLIGGPSGAKWGFLLGGALDQQDRLDQTGPRLSDLTVQTSQEGTPLATLYGTLRVSGNVIWSTGLEEVRHQEESGGGSGGGGSSTTYSYRTDVAVALCAGEITGIRRIWGDGKLIYDIGDSADYATLTASTARAKSLRIYPGSESQLPDPLIEAVEGAGNTPAFRGVAYVVLEDLELADFGNRVPNFTFEVVKAGGADALSPLLQSIAAPVGKIVSIRRQAGELTKVITWDGNLPWNGTTYPHRAYWWYLLPDGTWMLRASAYIHHIGVYNWQTCGITEIEDYGDDAFVLGNPLSYSKAFLVSLEDGDSASPSVRFYKLHYSLLANERNFVGRDYVAYTTNADIRVSRRSELQEVAPTLGTWGGYYGYGLAGTLLAEEPGHLATLVLPGETQMASVCLAADEMHVMTHVSPTNTVYHLPMDQFEATPGGSWTVGTLTYVSESAGAYHAAFLNAAHGGDDLLCMHDAADIKTCSVDYVWSSVGPAVLAPTAGPQISVVDQISELIYAVNTATVESVLSHGLLTPSTIPLSEVAESILDAAGVAAHDMSALAGLSVRGYAIAKPMPMRAALEPLMAAYHFDVAEIDGEILAVLRGGASVATLTEDDMGAAEVHAPKLTATRQNVIELPSRIDVSFIDAEADYQPGLQQARRLTASHENILTLQLPIALTTLEAARLAETHLNIAWWMGQYNLDMTLTFDHLRLVPTDVVDLPVFGQQVSARLLDITAGAPGLMQIQGVPDLPSLYVGAAVGADPVDLAQVLGITGPMRMVLMDCVMLRDTDNAPGLYVAGCGYMSTWPSGIVMRSNDGGATYGQAAVVTAAATATVGYATAALGNADCRVWDAANALNVRLLAGKTLSSATLAAVLNGANAALLGAQGRWELIQFRTAVLQADGTYTLTDLLRGRRGTEHAAASHDQFDTFVLLTDTSIQDIALSSGEIGATRHYKAVTRGQALESVAAERQTYAGERLECLSPVLLGGGRDASGNITLTWVRRDRINAGWLNNIDVPLSEASESYEVDIYTNNTYGTVKRTLTGLSGTTASYPSATQVTDFGANQATVYLRVYQLSATAGRGHYLQGAV